MSKHSPPSARDAWICHHSDDVAVALRDLQTGDTIAAGGHRITVRQPVLRGHKVALRPLDPGMPVIKYGAEIGRVSRPVTVGDHVHSHNLVTDLKGEMGYVASPAPASADVVAPTTSWRGYRRVDGRAATRNEIWIIPTVGCVGPMADQLARAATDRHGARIDGIFAFSHPHGCSQLGDDLAGTQAVLAGLIDNPNAAGVLLLGLGCESNQLDALLARVPQRSRAKVRTVRAQDAGDEYATAMKAIDRLVDEHAGHERHDLPLADLTVGLKCGGSDAYSGLTANPLLGRFSDVLTNADGRIVLTEIPEIFGAEGDLLARAISQDVFDRAAMLVNRFKRYFLDQGQPVSENPSPGNIAGGITTLEEKSLGAVQKSGRARLTDVIDYGMAVRLPGLTLLEAPGNDTVSSTALVAAGATLILFTTGRGTPLGFPVPTIKVSSSSELAAGKANWIDFDAGRMIAGDRDEVIRDFTSYVATVASGNPTAAERSGQKAIAIWKRGVTL